jgi:histidine ammonia-lyase
MNNYIIDNNNLLNIEVIDQLILKNSTLELSVQTKKNVEDCRIFLDNYILKANRPVYGINTGFGSLCNTKIEHKDLGILQENLVRSHACGTGEEVPNKIVKIMLLLKIKGLSFGHSGVQLQTLERLVDFYNNDVLPIIYSQGSLGASGDLAPLAHLCLPLFGEGEVYYKGRKISSQLLNQFFNWQPIQLQSKEGLALLNGTQFMSAYAVECLLNAEKIAAHATKIAACSLEGFDGLAEPFDELLHNIRNHFGQNFAAKKMREYLNGSQIQDKKKEQVQDPYSFRCIPQVHGTSIDAVNYVKKVVEKEINSVTDNPTIFPEHNKIISGGNFHGQCLAVALDLLAIALSELGNISERRTYLLISGQRGLPAFLTANPGLNSGFMILQYTAASIVSQNKQYCSPASVDSIVSSNGQEDHVSMGANAATKCLKVVENVFSVLGIELICAAQALDFRKPLISSTKLEDFKSQFRNQVPFLENDTYLHPHIKNAEMFLKEN